MIKLLYFASLREQLGTGTEQIDFGQQTDNIASLKAVLSQRDDSWATAFACQTALLVSVNQQMANDKTALADGDEVAFFPPVTGG